MEKDITFWEEQMNHEPTRLYYEALKTFDIKGKRVLEIGVQYGISTKAFLEGGAILDSVDPNIYPDTLDNLKDFNNWNFHQVTSDEYFATCKEMFDLIYIDGDHHYKSTKSDLNNAFNHIKSGTIVVHDFLHNHNFHYKEKKCKAEYGYGITQACCEIIKERKLTAEILMPYPGFIRIKI